MALCDVECAASVCQKLPLPAFTLCDAHAVRSSIREVDNDLALELSRESLGPQFGGFSGRVWASSRPLSSRTIQSSKHPSGAM